jgi:acetyl esterase/lipase
MGRNGDDKFMPLNRRKFFGDAVLSATGFAGLAIAARGAETAPAERAIPVPATASAALQARIAAPGNPNWRLKPASAGEWHAIVKAAAAASEANIAAWSVRYGIEIAEDTLGGVRVFWLAPRSLSRRNRRRIVLDFHGGAYVYAPGRSGLEDALLVARAGFRVVCPDYRMAPDHPYPAAIDDAEAVWCELAKRNPPKRLAVCGTSTGGGMTLALIHRLKAKRLPLPGAIWAGTPWSDLTKTGDSYWTNELVDRALVGYDGILGAAAELYAAGHDMKDPELSPVYGTFDGFPPTHLTTGTRDLFLSNTVRVQRKLLDAGVPTELTVIEALSHADYVGLPDSAESHQVYGDVARFFDRHLML